MEFLVTLGVADLARSTRFYEEGLGLERAPFPSDTIAFFDAGGTQLALFGREELAADAGVAARGEGFRGVTLALRLGSSAEVKTMLERAVAAGGALLKPPQPVFWGGFSGYFEDPDGHLWEVACGSAEYAAEKDREEGA